VAQTSGSRPPEPGPLSRLAGLAALLRSHSGFADVVTSLEEGHGATIGGTWGSSSALAAAALARELGDERILVVVLPHAVDAERFVDDLALFTDLPVAHLPALESFAVGEDDVADDPAAEEEYQWGGTRFGKVFEEGSAGFGKLVPVFAFLGGGDAVECDSAKARLPEGRFQCFTVEGFDL
jgi:hypothetical protein